MTTSRRGLFGLMAGAAVAPVIGQAGPHKIIAGLRRARGGVVHLRSGFVGERGPEYVVRAYADLPTFPGPREGDLARVVNIVN